VSLNLTSVIWLREPERKRSSPDVDPQGLILLPDGCLIPCEEKQTYVENEAFPPTRSRAEAECIGLNEAFPTNA
jgi:hypothetical protein